MIIKSFNLNSIKNAQSNIYLLYGLNDGHKEETIHNYFLKDFKGEVIRYEENQILENIGNFFETCFSDSLFENNKIIIISRISKKFYEIVPNLMEKEIQNKKIILNCGQLEKRSKLRELFEKDKNLICIPFYEDNVSTLYTIASKFFKNNNISISSENINLLVEKCSGDRKNLLNELDKVFNYCFEKKKISKDELVKLINMYDDDNYFKLIDWCLSRNHHQVCKIINNSSFDKKDSIILIRSLLSRLKRLIELKKLQGQIGNIKDTINNFRPPIFWKDKEVVEKQVNSWSKKQVLKLLDDANNLEINFKRNPNLSNNIVFDLILNTSSN